MTKKLAKPVTGSMVTGTTYHKETYTEFAGVVVGNSADQLIVALFADDQTPLPTTQIVAHTDITKCVPPNEQQHEQSVLVKKILSRHHALA